MPRLRNKLTGVVVNVSDDTATKLGADWELEKAPKAKPSNKRTTAVQKTSTEKTK